MDFASQRHLSVDAYKFEYQNENCISFQEVDEKLSSKNMEKIIECLDDISDNSEKIVLYTVYKSLYIENIMVLNLIGIAIGEIMSDKKK